MSKMFLFLGVFLSFSLWGGALLAHDSEVNFDKKIPLRERLEIHKFLKTETVSWSVSALDLNQDGLNEYILKSDKCPDHPLCDFKIIAKSADHFLEIAHIKAQRLETASTSHSGIWDILAYQNPHNDFKHHVYIWDSTQSHYRRME